MKIVVVKKISIITFSLLGKNYYLYLILANHLHNSSKPCNFLNKEFVIIWTQLCLLTHADHMPLLQENITFIVMTILPMIHSDIIQEDKSLELQPKEVLFIIQIFHMMVTYGTSAHQWNMTMK